MEDKKDKKRESRSDRMYKNSPKLEKDKETGKVGMTRGSKESAEVSSGTNHIAEHESHMQELEHKHSKERMDMFHKHEKEHMELKHKVLKETMKDEAHEKSEEKSGGKLIEKVEKDKKTGDE
jgi:hypothetical protein